MSNAASRLDVELEALRAALRAGDRALAAVRLRAIDEALSEITNPLVRGLAYANVQAELGHPEKAVRVVEDLLEVMGDEPLAHHHLGRHRRAAGDIEGAVAAFARSCELDPMRTTTWLELGTLLDERGDPETAIDCYREALRRAPTDFDVWRNLGNSLAALERFDEAIAAYATALGERPSDRTVLLLHAAAHQAKGDIEQANAVTPAELQHALGEVVEVRNDDGAPAMACRFRAPNEQRDHHRRAAETLLAEARRDLPTEREATSRPPWFLVRQADLVLVCDRDPRRPHHPNRFFDASDLVSRRAAGD